MRRRLPSRGAAVLLIVGLASRCHYPEGYGCPDIDYVPTGPVLEDGCDCENGVPFECWEGCDGPAEITCEPIESVREFLQGECATCWVDTSRFAAGTVSIQCGERRY